MLHSMLDSNYLDAIKNFEGYSSKASWDYAQHSNGYGTRARFAGEEIDKAEAERRFAGEIRKAAEFVESVAPDLDAGSKAALTSLTYNAGRTWATSGLGEAVASGDMNTARSLFLQYNKAGGSTVDGLVQRRLQEVAWFGQGDRAAAPFTSIVIQAPQEKNAAIAALPETAGVETIASAQRSSVQLPAVAKSPDTFSILAPDIQASSRAFARLAGDPVLLSLLEQLGKAQTAREENEPALKQDAGAASA